MRAHVLGRLLLAVLLGLGVAVGVPAAPASADEIRDRQWQLGFLLARQAWQHSTGAGVTVAVIDSGVDASHPDLRGKVLPGADFVDSTTDGRTDVVGHGTSVAALIAGRDDDSRGVVGLAPQAKILPIRVLDAENQYESAEQVARALRWAVDHGAKVVNVSLGSAEYSEKLSQALFYAFQRDVVVVACVGNLANNRGTQVWHPAREPGVLAVGGITSSGAFWNGSLQGDATVLSAPAANIVGAYPGGSYWRIQGTSFASPLVAATAALVRSRYPKMDAANVINRLVRTAWDFGPVGRDGRFGFGIVNPTKALTAKVPPITANPLLRPRAENWGGIAPGGPESPGIPDAVGSRPPQAAEALPRTTLALIALACVGLVMGGVGATVLLMVGRRRRTLAPAGAALAGAWSSPDWSAARPPDARSADTWSRGSRSAGARSAEGRVARPPDTGRTRDTERTRDTWPVRETPPSRPPLREPGEYLPPPRRGTARTGLPTPPPAEHVPTTGRARGVARIPEAARAQENTLPTESGVRTAWQGLGRYRLDEPPGPDYPY